MVKFTGKHLCQSLFFDEDPGLSNFIKNEALAQVLSCEFCEIFKNTFFTEHLRALASLLTETANRKSLKLRSKKWWKVANFSTISKRTEMIQKQQPEVFFKKSVLKNFANFRGKQLCFSLFLIKLEAFGPAVLLKRDSNTGVFL